MDRRRAERDVRAVVAGRPGALDEQRDPERVLARPLARRSRGASTPDATSTPTAGISRRAAATLAGVQAAGQDDRHLAGDRRGQPSSRRALPVPPGCGPPAVSSEEALGARRRGRRGRGDGSATIGGRGRPAPSAGTWSTFQAGRGSAASRRDRLLAMQLDRVRVDRRR